MGDTEKGSKIIDNGCRKSETTVENSNQKTITSESKSECESIKGNKTVCESTDESNSESETTIESKADECKEINRIMDLIKAEKISIDEAEKCTDKSIVGNDAKDTVKENYVCTEHVMDEERRKKIDRCASFAVNSLILMQRIYDDYKKGISTIVELKLPQVCSPPYVESVYRYNSKEALEKYSDIIQDEKRGEKLEEEFKHDMIVSGNNKQDFEFLLDVALCFLAAFDIKEILGFEEAPRHACCALGIAMNSTNQYGWLEEWSLLNE